MKERTKKLKKLTVTAAVLAATIAMSATSAMAAWSTNEKGDPIGNTTDAIVIGKSLKMPKNWEPETLSVTFNVTPVGFSKNNGTYDKVDGLAFGSNGKVTLSKADFAEGAKDDQVKYWKAETGDLVGSISYGGETGLAAIAKIAEEKQSTGTVKFTVTESAFSYTEAANTTSIASEASYDLVFWIDYVANSDGTSSYKVTSITDTKTTKDDGTEADQKVDPTKGSTDVKTTTYTTVDEEKKIDTTDTSAGFNLSGMLFNNDITKNDVPDTPDTPTPDDYAFKLAKVVTNGGDANQKFKFTVKMTAPNLGGVAADKTVTVNVYNKNDSSKVLSTKTFTYGGTENTIELKADEVAVFSHMYNSTKVEVTEAGTPSYTATVSGSFGDATGTVGQSLSKDGVTNDEDVVTYTNAYSSITPTGIIMNNLPFFMMILIGAAAVVAGFAFQARRRVADK